MNELDEDLQYFDLYKELEGKSYEELSRRAKNRAREIRVFGTLGIREIGVLEKAPGMKSGGERCKEPLDRIYKKLDLRVPRERDDTVSDSSSGFIGKLMGKGSEREWGKEKEAIALDRMYKKLDRMYERLGYLRDEGYHKAMDCYDSGKTEECVKSKLTYVRDLDNERDRIKHLLIESILLTYGCDASELKPLFDSESAEELREDMRSVDDLFEELKADYEQKMKLKYKTLERYS